MKVFLDAGHGGENTGCRVGYRHEKDVTLDLVRTTADILRPLCLVTGSRSHDISLSFAERARRAQEAKCALALVVHVNAFKESTMCGGQAYYMNKNAIGLATARAFVTALPYDLRGTASRVFSIDQDKRPDWMEAPHTVLKHYQCPAVLLEVGFATNPGDLKVLLSELGRNAISCAIASTAIQGLRALSHFLGDSNARNQ